MILVKLDSQMEKYKGCKCNREFLNIPSSLYLLIGKSHCRWLACIFFGIFFSLFRQIHLHPFSLLESNLFFPNLNVLSLMTWIVPCIYMYQTGIYVCIYIYIYIYINSFIIITFFSSKSKHQLNFGFNLPSLFF